VDPGRGMVKRSSVYRLPGRHNWSRRKLMMFTLSSPLTTVRSLERLGTNERVETPVSFARPFWISQGRCSCTGHIHSTRLAPAPPRNEPLATELADVSSPSCSQKGSCHQCGGYLATAMPSAETGLLSAQRSIKETCGRPDADEWRRVHAAELRRRDAEPFSWTYEDPLPCNLPLRLASGTRRGPTCTEDSSATRLAA
jgi:hypothetical protein